MDKMELLQDLSVDFSQLVKKHIKGLKKLSSKDQKAFGKLFGDFKDGLDDMSTNESVNEGVEPQIKKIAYFTGTRPEAVEDFVSKHSLNITKLLKYVEKGKLPQRMELVSALAGRPNNPIQKKIIKMFSESVNEGKFKVDDLVYNKRTKTVGIVRMGDDKYGEVKTDADGNVSVDELEKYNPIKNRHHQKVKVAPSTEKEINKRGLFNPFKNESVTLKEEVESLNEMSPTLEKMIYFAMGVFRLPRMNRVLYKWVTDPKARQGSIKLSDEDIKMMFDEFNIKLPKNAFKD